jgi:hypothetical protein
LKVRCRPPHSFKIKISKYGKKIKGAGPSARQGVQRRLYAGTHLEALTAARSLTAAPTPPERRCRVAHHDYLDDTIRVLRKLST